MSSAAEALPESHWIARHLLPALPAAAKLNFRIAYGELRTRVVRPLRDACALRGSDEERAAVEAAGRWLRALVADELGAIHSVLQDPATAPPAVAEVGYEVARCKLTWMVVMECLSDEACDAGVRRFWLERLLIDAVALDGAMARNPTWASELRAELDREDIRAALGRGDVKHVRSRIDDPRSHLTEVDRARYRRLLSFSTRIDGPSLPSEEPPSTPRLRSSPEATWVAIHRGAEVARGPNLSELLRRARGMGVDDPLLVWLPV